MFESVENNLIVISLDDKAYVFKTDVSDLDEETVDTFDSLKQLLKETMTKAEDENNTGANVENYTMFDVLEAFCMLAEEHLSYSLKPIGTGYQLMRFETN